MSPGKPTHTCTYTNTTAEGYLRPHAEVCARRRVIFCTGRRSASFRTDIDDIACIGIETPGSDPPARWPRYKKRGKRGDAGEDAWRDPCNARRIAGIRPSPLRTVDDGTCGPGVNTGDSRSNQKDRSSAQQKTCRTYRLRIYRISPHQAMNPMSRSHLHVDWRHPMHWEL